MAVNSVGSFDSNINLNLARLAEKLMMVIAIYYQDAFCQYRGACCLIPNAYAGKGARNGLKWELTVITASTH